MSTRRGFLAGVLAVAVAPAIAKSGVLMPIKPRIILPSSLSIALSNVEAGAVYSFSVWLKEPGDRWVQHVHTFKAENGQANLLLPLHEQNTQAHSFYLSEVGTRRVDPFRHVGMDISVNNGSLLFTKPHYLG